MTKTKIKPRWCVFGTLFIVLFYFTYTIPVLGQQHASVNVKGTVRDSLQHPIPNVSVRLSGGKVVASTDRDGMFTINVPANATLLFSSVGYNETSVAIGNQTQIDIQLVSSNIGLEEIVIVGTSMKQKDLTGAVVSLGESTLNERPVTSVNEALQGKAAGVFIQTNPQPGGDANIKIRGNNSMQYGGNPIYVVDGIIMESDFNMLNLNDITSINVLKDASSTALYGSRGAQGVVVITTKKGSRGEGQINYDTWIGFQNFANTDLTLGAKDSYELRIDALENAESVGGKFYKNNPGASRQDFIAKELFGPGKLWFADYEKESYKQGKSFNWLDAVTRTAIEHNHSLSFSGGNDKGSFYLSFGYNNKQGLVKTSNYKRYTGRVNVERMIKPWLKVGTNTSFTATKDDYVDGKVFQVAQNANPLLPISQDSLVLAWGNNWDVNLENPLNTMRIDKDRLRNKLLSSNYVNISPIAGLNIRSTFSVDLLQSKYYEYIPSDIQQAKRDSYRGKASHNFNHNNNFQWDNSVSYTKNIGVHHLDGMVATNFSQNSNDYTNVTARDFPIDDFGYYNLGAAYDKLNFSLGSDFISSRIMSYVARFNYNYDNKYYATITGRYDGSSKFPQGKQWGLFPSVALAWDISQESFLKDNGTVDLLKLRMGYGQVGNQRIPDYAFYSLYYPSYTSGSVIFNSNGQLGTTDLTWEKQKQLNIGVDASFFGKRINLTAEYFNIVNSNLLMRRSLSTLTGYNSAIVNIGEMTNKGMEFTLDAKIVHQENFKWNLGANISFDKNRITKLFGDVDAVYNFGGFSGTDIQREGNFFLGRSLNTIYMLEFDRIIQESDMDYVNSLDLPGKKLQPGDILPKDQQAPGEAGYGIIDQNDRVIIGKKDPKFYGGFSSSWGYKNVALNAVFVYSYGAKALSGFYEGLMSGTGYGAAHQDMLDRWTADHPSTSIPRANYDNSLRFGSGETSWGVQDASFLRLATLSLAYDFSKDFLKKIGLNSLKLNVSGNNLFNITKYKGYDPENGDWYPTARTFVVGLNVGL
ncbi:TonB-dependent receptor [Sphingobacterium sp. HMA12]|uniref:SusC/RagA family TonB-linked outer membrane protein n=1 Tax=Sphingobacterium sp. HMA12 TaxID=2050894 RepID=UPI000CE9D09C|nr:TonB-dependent receptor [Sphingobacterium sp. HMA12]